MLRQAQHDVLIVHLILSRHLPADHYRNSLALGVDIETGGHIFQMHVTNSPGMIEQQFVSETTGNFFKGDIFFGFNISRNFTVKQRRLH